MPYYLCKSFTKATVLSSLRRIATLFTLASRLCRAPPCFPIACLDTFVQCIRRHSLTLEQLSWIFSEYCLSINAFSICMYVQSANVVCFALCQLFSCSNGMWSVKATCSGSTSHLLTNSLYLFTSCVVTMVTNNCEHLSRNVAGN
jgi:hypothetical protein